MDSGGFDEPVWNLNGFDSLYLYKWNVSSLTFVSQFINAIGNSLDSSIIIDDFTANSISGMGDRCFICGTGNLTTNNFNLILITSFTSIITQSGSVNVNNFSLISSSLNGYIIKNSGNLVTLIYTNVNITFVETTKSLFYLPTGTISFTGLTIYECMSQYILNVADNAVNIHITVQESNINDVNIFSFISMRDIYQSSLTLIDSNFTTVKYPPTGAIDPIQESDFIIVTSPQTTILIPIYIENCVFSSNEVTSLNFNNGNVTIIGGEYSNNIGTYGITITGGILQISNFNFINNIEAYLLSAFEISLNLDTIIFDGNHLTSAGFDITRSSSIISNITIKNNVVLDKAFSFLQIRGTSLLSTNLLATNNSGILGGVIYCADDSSISLLNTNFSLNFAEYGGALYSVDYCEFTIDSLLAENSLVTSDGGVMWISGNTYGSVTNASFTNNMALGSGGAIVFEANSTLSFTNINFEKNSALTGGCIYVGDNSNPVFEIIDFSDCSAQTSGGAITINSYASPIFRDVIIHDCIANSIGSAVIALAFTTPFFENVNIEYNYSPNEGAGMYIEDEANVNMQNVSFTKNIARGSGAALYITINGTAYINECLFSENESGSKGGAIVILNQGNPTINNSRIENNSANSGGALYFSDTATPYFYNTQISNNIAQSRGGAVYISNKANCYFENCTIDYNSALTGTGGGILLQDFAFASLQDSKILNNTATYGGGIYAISNYSIEAYACTISGNYATYSGGGIVVGESSTSKWSYCTCSYNIANKGNGGCLSGQEDSNSTINYSTFQNNVAKFGGAVSAESTTSLSTLHCDISFNNATIGAGLYISADSKFVDSNSTISNNTATESGGGMSVSGNNVYLNGIRFLYNNAIVGGGIAITYYTNSAYMNNCHFEGNSAKTGGAISLIMSKTADDKEPQIFNWDSIDIIEDQSINQFEKGYDFVNTTLIRNIAENGGAIFIESLEFMTPTFGPSCLFQENIASMFGGAIAFGKYFREIPIIYGGQFINNTAYYGASNVGFAEIDNVTIASKFCNCTYINNFLPTSYQTPNGYASQPTSLLFENNDNPCPGTITLDSAPTEIDVYLVDKFSTVVHGDFLVDIPISVALDYSSDNIKLSTNSFTQNISADTGYAAFTNTILCGPNNSTIALSFSSSLSSILLPLTPVSCSILLYGCAEGYDVETSDTSSCDICVEIQSHGMLITVILVSVIIGLCLILCLIGGAFAAWHYWKKRERDRLQALEIPDFTQRPSLTLEDILNDPAIPRLEWDDIEIGEPIGKGASGIVSKGLWKMQSGKKKDIALKELILGFQDFGIEVLEEFLVEIKFMSALINPNIVQFLGIAIPDSGTKLYLVTELMHYGSVRDLLDKKADNLPFDMRIQIAKDAAKGVAYLHSKKLIHRDLKTQNLLVNNTWSCKVADFGISTVNPTVTRAMTCIGTPVYMAPEVLSKNKYSEKADVYSFGIVLAEIFTGKPPYSQSPYNKMNQAQLMYKILEERARPNITSLPISLQQLIEDCWSIDPRLRPSFPELVVRLRRLKGQITKQEQTQDENILVRSDSLYTTGSSTEFSLTGEMEITTTITNEFSLN